MTTAQAYSYGQDALRGRRIARMRTLAALLDNDFRIPVLGLRYGLDPILGLFPVWGDLIAALAGLFIIYDAHRLGARPALLALMVLNLALDTALGAIPIVGDLFDFAFKANTRNLALMGLAPRE